MSEALNSNNNLFPSTSPRGRHPTTNGSNSSQRLSPMSLHPMQKEWKPNPLAHHGQIKSTWRMTFPMPRTSSAHYIELQFLSAQELISAIYEAGWDKLPAGDNNQTLRQMVASHFNRNQNCQHKNPSPSTSQENHGRVSKILPPRPSVATLTKSKYNQGNKTFAQATKQSVENVLKIRDAFSSFPSKKVIEMHNAAFNNNSHSHPQISMTTKGPS